VLEPQGPPKSTKARQSRIMKFELQGNEAVVAAACEVGSLALKDETATGLGTCLPRFYERSYESGTNEFRPRAGRGCGLCKVLPRLKQAFGFAFEQAFGEHGKYHRAENQGQREHQFRVR